jgi:hypothetical protein
LAKDDPEPLQTLKERVAATSHDPHADYDTEHYDGKENDIRNALAELINTAKDPGTPAEKAEVLKQAAQIIAEFYGMEGELQISG